MSMRYSMIGLTLGCVATGCAFFDEPVSNPGELIPPSVPAIETQTPEPSPAALPSAPVDSQQSLSTAAAPQAEQSANYLVVAPIDQFPRDAQNIAVVHLTARDTKRELALCKALMQNMPAIHAEDLPPNPLTVVVWPVPNDNAGSNCIEMISDFEPIEITAEAAKRIDNNAEGPFLLARNLPGGNRMIFDISFMSNSALSSTINQWITLLGSRPADWPEYRRAR